MSLFSKVLSKEKDEESKNNPFSARRKLSGKTFCSYVAHLQAHFRFVLKDAEPITNKQKIPVNVKKANKCTVLFKYFLLPNSDVIGVLNNIQHWNFFWVSYLSWWTESLVWRTPPAWQPYCCYTPMAQSRRCSSALSNLPTKGQSPSMTPQSSVCRGARRTLGFVIPQTSLSLRSLLTQAILLTSMSSSKQVTQAPCSPQMYAGQLL